MAKVKKMGLALGGGSARGFSHIGVLKVLIENKIPIHSIAGCSMGSLIGGIYASEANLETLENLAVVFDYKKYFDLTLSTTGYIKGDKVQELIKLMTKNLLIERAKIPFCCIATHFEKAELKRFTEGPIHEAIRASISIPAMFTPHVIDGNTYVDGGVIDRTAVDAAWAMEPEVVVAVDVAYRGEYTEAPKSVVKLAQASFTIADWHLAQIHLPKADLCIIPELTDIKGSRYKDIQEIIVRGAEAAQKALPEIKKLLGIK